MSARRRCDRLRERACRRRLSAGGGIQVEEGVSDGCLTTVKRQDLPMCELPA